MTDELSDVFAALADPTRRAILAQLAKGSATVGELAEPFALGLPTVSRHIAALEKAGLVRKSRRGQERVVEIEGARLRDAETWIAGYRRFFEGRFDALARQLGRGGPSTDRTESIDD